MRNNIHAPEFIPDMLVPGFYTPFPHSIQGQPSLYQVTNNMLLQTFDGNGQVYWTTDAYLRNALYGTGYGYHNSADEGYSRDMNIERFQKGQ